MIWWTGEDDVKKYVDDKNNQNDEKKMVSRKMRKDGQQDADYKKDVDEENNEKDEDKDDARDWDEKEEESRLLWHVCLFRARHPTIYYLVLETRSRAMSSIVTSINNLEPTRIIIIRHMYVSLLRVLTA